MIKQGKRRTWGKATGNARNQESSLEKVDDEDMWSADI